MTDQFYRPKSHVTIITPAERRDIFRQRLERVMLAIVLLLVLAGSGYAETQRIKVMEETSSSTTMQQMGITQ